MPKQPIQTAVITISLWRDCDGDAPLVARVLTSQDGGRPGDALAACGIDDICDFVRAFLLVNFA